jgi:hypothetical protein
MSHTKTIHSRETMVSKGAASGFKFHDRIKRRLPFRSSCPDCGERTVKPVK